MFAFFRRRLGAKLFLSYLIIIIVGALVLVITAELAVPSAFERHMSAMAEMMQGNPTLMNMDLFANFRLAVTEALSVATLAALLAAILLSVFVSRQVVAPVRELMSASQRIANGNYDERVHVAGDIASGEQDELGQLALTFNRMAAQLERTEEIRRQLIGDVAHELRTPLTTIKGSMEGLIDGVLPADDETYLNVYKEVDRLQRLVNDLQDLSRVEAGAFEMHRRSVKLVSVVESVSDRLGRQFEEKGVKLFAAIPADLPPVSGDEDRLIQVLLNLVGNALQYTPPGGRVQVSAQQENGEVRVAVVDNGIGISAEHLPHLFTRFYRVDRSRSRVGGGSGIGLTIARHLVEAHGGRIWVHSEGLGQGSAFYFTLPGA